MNDLWINRSHNTHARNRIVCFPHAGGSSSFFKNWATQFPLSEICSVRYPGRAERIAEEQPNNIVDLAKNIAAAVQEISDLPLVLFGHSMGAAIAFETAKFLEGRGTKISHLLASGSRNGPFPNKETYIEEDDENLCKHLIEMGGTSAEIINDPIFLDLVLPSIRADGKMFHEYKTESQSIITCPITTIYGDNDIHTDIRPWAQMTSGPFREEIVNGDHFYLISNPPYDLINAQISELFSQRISSTI